MYNPKIVAHSVQDAALADGGVAYQSTATSLAM